MLRRFFSPKKVYFSTNQDLPSRNMFIVSLEYKVSLDKVELHLEAHREFLNENYRNNNFVVSGKKVPRTGGIIIAYAQDRFALEVILNNDPFMKNGIADYEITEFVPSMYNKDFLNIDQNDISATTLAKK
jgi:uncharacterized protein YciI